mmetsp:Transcript_11300/g.45757  ORF Transcript_11300/g.45757 Transcript_11300/m.45757 type:complete len:255 (+) Transcript_11300:196-960(+)
MLRRAPVLADVSEVLLDDVLHESALDHDGARQLAQVEVREGDDALRARLEVVPGLQNASFFSSGVRCWNCGAVWIDVYHFSNHATITSSSRSSRELLRLRMLSYPRARRLLQMSTKRSIWSQKLISGSKRSCFCASSPTYSWSTSIILWLITWTARGTRMRLNAFFLKCSSLNMERRSAPVPATGEASSMPSYWTQASRHISKQSVLDSPSVASICSERLQSFAFENSSAFASFFQTWGPSPKRMITYSLPHTG